MTLPIRAQTRQAMLPECYTCRRKTPEGKCRSFRSPEYIRESITLRPDRKCRAWGPKEKTPKPLDKPDCCMVE